MTELTKDLGVQLTARTPLLIKSGFTSATKGLAATLLQRKMGIKRAIALKSSQQISEELTNSSQGTLIGDRLNQLRAENPSFLFYTYAGFIQLLLNKASEYESQHGTKVSEEEIIRLFEREITTDAQ